MFQVPRTETERWTNLNILNPAENPGQMEALRDCRLDDEDEYIDLAWVRFDVNEEGDGDEEMDDNDEVDGEEENDEE